MAEVKATLWVEDAVRGQDGGVFVLKTAETHSKKDESGKYQTIARTYRDVKVSRSSGINLEQFAKGDRIDVAGREVTETRPSTGEKEFRTLVIWADSIVSSGSGNRTPRPAAEPAPFVNDWATANVNPEPF